jgi:CRISPR-associated protein Cas1
MIKRTIDISDGPTFLSVENDQLVLQRKKVELARVPCEDIGILLIDHPATTATHAVFTRLLHHGGMVILCGPNHQPAGLVLPTEANDLTGQRVRLRARAPRPLRKRLWKQIVRAKIRGQAMNLPEEHAVRKRLLEMVSEVRSGDPGNIEGQAARFYWPALLGESFRRDPDGTPPNNLLNYGYAVARAAVARAIVAAGLHPALALQHSHRHNAFALADDLVEVLRPRVDAIVLSLHRAGVIDVDRTAKQALLGLLGERVTLAGQAGPLMVHLHRLATSLVRCYENEATKLDLPTWAAESPQILPLPPLADEETDDSMPGGGGER